MIRVPLVPEPPTFDAEARQPGNRWLAEHPAAERPRDYWSPFKPDLAAGSQNRCAYTALWEVAGTVDHFKAWANNRPLAYEWTNYRFAAQWINSSKRFGDVLDPHEVGDDWFEILLPSLQLIRTDKVPADKIAIADATLDNLPIRDDERIVRYRQAWYELYRSGDLRLSGLRKVAPQIAAAVEKKLAAAAGSSPTQV